MSDDYYMKEALKEAKEASSKGEVPVGAIIVKNGKIIGRGHNLRETTQQVVAHAEMMAIKQACDNEKSWRLDDCDIYITLEPCPMCAGAIIQSRIRRVIYAAKDYKHGAHTSQINLFDAAFNHRVNLQSGLLKEEAQTILTDFFMALRIDKDSV